MELKQIQYFETAYKRKSFSKAAEELFVTQQCVSKNIQSLEQELGAPLFVRNSYGVTLTEEGRYFHEQAAPILERQNEIIDHFRDLHHQREDLLQVGISRGLRFFFDEHFFQAFKKMYPEIDWHVVDLWNAQTEKSVQEHTIDVGITLAPVKDQQLVTEHLWQEPIYCIVNGQHKYANHSSLSMKDILDERIVTADENYNSYYTFQNVCSKAGKSPSVTTFLDLMSIYEYVLHHNVVGFTLKSYANILQFQNIKHIPLNDPDANWDICLIYNQDTNNPWINKFIDYTKTQKA